MNEFAGHIQYSFIVFKVWAPTQKQMQMKSIANSIHLSNGKRALTPQPHLYTTNKSNKGAWVLIFSLLCPAENVAGFIINANTLQHTTRFVLFVYNAGLMTTPVE